MTTTQEAIYVFIAALFTALATGLGALPFVFVKNMSERWIGLASGLAAGFMIGASIGLCYEGGTHSVPKVFGGLLIGYVGIHYSMRWLDRWKEAEDARPESDVAGKARSAANWWMSTSMRLVLVMTIHSFSEGIAVGVAWGGGGAFGIFVAIAIAIHNIPEGLAISVVMVSRGESVGKAARMSIVSSLPQPLMAVPAFLFVEQFATLLPWGLGFAAGAMLWITFSDLIPDALENAGRRSTIIAALIAAAGMIILQAALVPK